MEREMEAAFYKQTEPSEQVLVVGDLPDPQPATGEVRVRLQWSGLNPSNVKARVALRNLFRVSSRTATAWGSLMQWVPLWMQRE
jgi:NADPH:quinone reductase-like Zn-dependent oxidoreductase